jgi:hypothetical protein
MRIKATAKVEREVEQELKLADPSPEIAKAIIEGNKNGTLRHSDESDSETKKEEV